jgi:hypothetical protein
MAAEVIMRDYSLLPVGHQPDFSDVSLVPIDHDPFSGEGLVRQAQALPASSQPESASQPPASRTGQPDADAPADPRTDRNLRSAPGDNYPTADAAAIAALQSVYPTSRRYGLEYVGRIHRTRLGFGDYSYAPPREGEAFRSNPGNSVLVPLFHSLGVNAGTNHTHTRGLDPERDEDYSPRDKDVSDQEENLPI